MRSCGALLIPFLASCCAGQPTGEARAIAAPVDAAQIASWHITAGRARTIAVTVMEPRLPSTTYVDVIPAIDNGAALWLVGYSDPLGGGWDVRLDANTGAVMSARRLPGR